MSRLQSTADPEKQRMLIPVSTTGIRMGKLSLQKSYNYSTAEIRMTVIVVYATKVQPFGHGRFTPALPNNNTLDCFLTIIPCLALRGVLELNTH